MVAMLPGTCDRVPGHWQGALSGHILLREGWGVDHLLISVGLKGRDRFVLETRDGSCLGYLRLFFLSRLVWETV